MENELTHGPVMKTMLKFAIPMILGDLLQAVLQYCRYADRGTFSRSRRPRRGRFGVFSDDIFNLDTSRTCHGGAELYSPSGSARKTRQR